MGEEGQGLGLEYSEQSVGANNGFELGLFTRGQLILGAARGKIVVAGLGLGIGLNIRKTTGEFEREVLRERTEESLQCGCRAVFHARRVARFAGWSEGFLV